MGLTLVNKDGTTTQQVLELSDIKGDWRIFALKVEATKPFRYIILDLKSGNGSWNIWFDAMQLYVDDIPVQILNPSFEN